jgi:hypothetical protein
VNAPPPVKHGVLAYTGTEVLLAQGMTSVNAYYYDLWSYDLASGKWSARPGAYGAPRWGHAGAWTGSTLLVYSGGTTGFGSGPVTDAREYDPLTKAWTMNATGLEFRNGASALNIGAEVLFWGGMDRMDYASAAATGFTTFQRYAIGTKAWSATNDASPLAARAQVAAAWTGNHAVYWGGFMGSSYFSDGARYAPAAGTWTMLPAAGAPSARRCAAAAWTGKELIVWGGMNAAGEEQVSGAILSGI